MAVAPEQVSAETVPFDTSTAWCTAAGGASAGYDLDRVSGGTVPFDTSTTWRSAADGGVRDAARDQALERTDEKRRDRAVG